MKQQRCPTHPHPTQFAKILIEYGWDMGPPIFKNLVVK
jgi:hypothetical protein